MKTHEETWDTPWPGDHLFLSKWGDIIAKFEGSDTVARTKRARLAREAPAMARLLKRLFDAADYDEVPEIEIFTVLRDAGVLP